MLDCIEISSELRSHGQAGSDGVVPGSHDVMTNKYLVTLTGYYDRVEIALIMSLCVKTERRKQWRVHLRGGPREIIAR